MERTDIKRGFEKNYAYIILFMHFFFVGSAYSQILIKGKIYNYDGTSKVHYNPTLEGVNTAYSYTYVVAPNARGEFTIKYYNKGIGTTRLTFQTLTYSFLHKENSEITVSIDQSKIKYPKEVNDLFKRDVIRDSVKQAATVSIGGDFRDINLFYNKTIRSFSRELSVEGGTFSLLIRNTTSPEKVVTIIDSLANTELGEINKLFLKIKGENNLNEQVDDSELEQIMKDQVYSYYGNVFLTGMMLKRIEQASSLSSSGNDSTIYDRKWQSLIAYFINQMMKKMSLSPTSYEHIEFLLNLEYVTESYRSDPREQLQKPEDDLIIERLVKPNIPALDSLLVLDPKLVFAYKLHNVSRFLNTQTFYSPTLLRAIDELKKQNPNSIHLSHFKEGEMRLRQYLDATTKEYKEAKIIDKNYVKFDDLLEVFRGKNILIDVWATWCPPCYDDFSYKDRIKDLIDIGTITILYISLDKSESRKKWKENIKANQLKGYHILADDILKEDMWNFLGGQIGTIPRYALIDKNGQMFLSSAARLKNSELLIAQIKSMDAVR